MSSLNIFIFMERLKGLIDRSGIMQAVYFADAVPLEGYPAVRIIPKEDNQMQEATEVFDLSMVVLLQVEVLMSGLAYSEAFKELLTKKDTLVRYLLTSDNWSLDGLVNDLQLGKCTYDVGIRNTGSQAYQNVLIARFPVVGGYVGTVE
jgi:hypothetical protein